MRAYTTALREMGGFKRDTISYIIHFVDPLSPDIHTQNIEGLLSRSKYFLRRKSGISQERHSEY